MKVKTVLHVTRRIKGGAGNASIRVHQSLLNNNIDSKLLILWPEESKISHYSFYLWAKKNQKVRVFIYQLLSKLKLYKIFFNGFYQSILDIHEHPEVQKADIIIFHQVDNFINARKFLRKTSDKIIYWRCPDFQPIAGYPYPNQLSWIWKGVRFPEKFKWVFTTETAQHIALSQIPALSKKNVLTIPNIIPENIIKSVKQNSKARDKTIVFISVNIYDERKGLQRVLDIWPTLEMKGYRLEIIGEHNNVTSQNPQIIYHGSMSSEKILEILSRSSFLITPAKNEMFGQTSIEALIFGTPVISTPTIGAMDIISEGVNGIFIKEKDEFSNPNSVLEAIMKFELIEWNNAEIMKVSRDKYHEDKSLIYLNNF